MVFWPLTISSAKPLRCPSLADLSRNRGLVLEVIKRVISPDKGTVKRKTSTSAGDISTIMYREPATVMTVPRICIRSLDRDSLTVSTS